MFVSRADMISPYSSVAAVVADTTQLSHLAKCILFCATAFRHKGQPAYFSYYNLQDWLGASRSKLCAALRELTDGEAPYLVRRHRRNTSNIYKLSMPCDGRRQIPWPILTDPRLKPHEKILVFALYNRRGNAIFADEIAKQTGISIKTVYQMMQPRETSKSLVGAGVLVPSSGGAFRVMHPDDWKFPDAMPRERRANRGTYARTQRREPALTLQDAIRKAREDLAGGLLLLPDSDD